MYYKIWDLTINLSDPDTEKDAEDAAQSVRIAPDPAPGAGPADWPYIGYSLRTKRGPGQQSFTRYASEFRLRVKTCPGEYLLKWRVAKATQAAGSSVWTHSGYEEVKKELNLKAEDFDQEGWHQIQEWIDVGPAEIQPGTRYHIVNYADGVSTSFVLEPKEGSGCKRCSGFGGTSSGKGSCRMGSVDGVFPLGLTASGASAGSLFLESENITPELATIGALRFSPGTAKDANYRLERVDGVLKQAITYGRVADITPLPAGRTGYTLKLFRHEGQLEPEEGRFFKVSDQTPIVTWTVERLADAAGQLRLDIAREDEAGQFTYAFGQGNTPATAANWSLAEKLNGSTQRQTTRTRAPVGDGSGDVYETTTLSDSAYGVASVTRQRLRTFAWGESVIEETLDPLGAQPLTTKYEYHTSGIATGQLLRTTSPENVVTAHDYVARTIGTGATLVNTAAPAGTTTTYPNGRVSTSIPGTLADTTLDADTLAEQLLTRTETLGGHIVSRSWTLTLSGTVAHDGRNWKETRTIEAFAPDALWSDARNPVTISRFSRDSATGQTRTWTLSPAGQLSLSQRGTAATPGGNVTSLAESGTPNAALTALVAGTRTTTVEDAKGRQLSRTVIDIATGRTLDLEEILERDPATDQPTLIGYLDGSTETRSYRVCCGSLESQTRHGLTTSYTYDELGRQRTVTAAGITTETVHDAADRVRRTRRYPAGTAPAQIDAVAIVLSSEDYDPAGRLTATRDGLNRTTTHQETIAAGTGITTRTTASPFDPAWPVADRPMSTVVSGPDGRTLSVTATAPVRYEYGTATLPDAAQWGHATTARFPYTREIKLDATGADTPETLTTYTDFLGRTLKVLYADGAAARSFYDAAGRLVRQVDPDGVQTLHAYIAPTATTGEIQVTALDFNRNGTIDYAGPDRITRQSRLVSTRLEASTTYTVQRSTTEVWETDASATPTTVSISESTPDGLRSWQTTHGLLTKSVTTYDSTAGTRTDTTTYPDNTSAVRFSQAGRVVRETRRNDAGTAIAETLYGYDTHGRPNVVSALQAPGSALPPAGSPLVTTTTYFADDQVHTVTTPDPDADAAGGPAASGSYDPQATTYAYDAAGRVSTVTQPAGGSAGGNTTQTFTTYWPTGAVKRTWGSRTYPSEYAYDAQGRVKTLTTWQNFAATTGAAVTTWNYSPTRGWLINKRYTDATGPDYDYWPSGRLKTRDWARVVPGTSTRLRTSYAYNHAGDLSTIDYADSTPDVTHTYDRLGRSLTTTDAAGLLTRSYQNGRLDDETYAAGSAHLSGFGVTRTQGAYNRPATLGATGFASVTYGYDTAGRLSTLTQGTRVATLGYKPLVGTHQSTGIAVSGVARYHSQRQTDALNRTSSVELRPWALGSVTLSRAYTYDDANQRTEVVHEDALRWAYGYDALGQVTSAQKQDASATLLPGYDHAYAYDTIGNRVQTITNGRLATYAPDLRNQYLSRTVPGALDVLGAASADVNVLVDEALAARGGESFHRAVKVDNAAAPAFKSVEIIAARPQGAPDGKDQVATLTRSAFIAQSPEVYVHDLDGNLTQDGRWAYTWDAENRLVQIETRADVAAQAPGLPRQKLIFVYDSTGRRVSKQVSSWNPSTSTFTLNPETKFLYDGWNLLAEYNALSSNAVVRSHVWGLDLSGSEQGAGGVGGLLWTSTTTATYAPAWDANGNIVAWINTATLAVSGRADYGPFGEVVQATGVARELPFGFSTKYTDAETGLVMYQLRPYSPATGRFIQRDPITESGGVNLYGFVGNNPVDRWDYLGLFTKAICCTKVQVQALRRAESRALGAAQRTEILIDTQYTLADILQRYPDEIQNTLAFNQVFGPWRLAVRSVVTKVQAGILGDYVVICTGEDGKKADGDTRDAYTKGTQKKIWFTNGYFNQSPDTQADYYLHEASHIFANTEDYNYGGGPPFVDGARDARWIGLLARPPGPAPVLDNVVWKMVKLHGRVRR